MGYADACVKSQSLSSRRGGWKKKDKKLKWLIWENVGFKSYIEAL